GHTLRDRQRAYGYTIEDLRTLMGPMAADGEEAIGSMGTDIPLAVLSDKSPLLYNYFKQLFAQVTNPPLDAIREELVTSSITNIGREQDLFEETPLHCHQLRLEQPILTKKDLQKIRELDREGLRACSVSILFQADGGEGALKAALDRIREEASQLV